MVLPSFVPLFNFTPRNSAPERWPRNAASNGASNKTQALVVEEPGSRRVLRHDVFKAIQPLRSKHCGRGLLISSVIVKKPASPKMSLARPPSAGRDLFSPSTMF